MSGARELSSSFLGLDPGRDDWAAETHAGPLRRSLSVGFLAMLPLFAAYEYGLAATHGTRRNAAELVVFRAFELLPEHGRALRIASLALASIAAGAVCFRRRVALGPSLLRVVLEGLFAAVLFGPAMALAMHLVPPGVAPLDVAAGPPPSPPGAAEAAIVFGGAAYEELVFRVGLLALAFLGARRIFEFFGAGERAARVSAQGMALLVSALAFAAFHLRAFTGWLGPGGEPFEAGPFFWRLFAGVLLGLLFLWRGPGVAAWTHGLFNFALFLGAGPEVLF